MSKLKRTGLLAAALCIAGSGCALNGNDAPKPPERTYSNPVKLADEWGDYGLGDPFVFAYDGYYYLYVSTRDTDAGVKVWRSADLVDWTYEGLCAEDPVTTGAYAPEVRYWNGKFYMYTSPAGQGHYVLVADKPTGPFKVATGNFGRTIDGTTFVDDDGQWYFYYAGPAGIQGAPMTDPLTVAPEESQTGAYMGGWTEGPTVFKHDGKYYMTYTGNHVFSAGYRVDAAVSDSPLRGFAGQPNNPVLLRTEGATVGLGHNSIVTGPDLDTSYIVYHNLEGHGVVGPLRHLNLDRLVWDGGLLRAAGPTSEPQPAPGLPAFADRFERDRLGGAWKRKGAAADWSVKTGEGLAADAAGKDGLSLLLAGKETGADYTAEFHVRQLSGATGEAGVVFSYKDDRNYGLALWHEAERRFEVRVVRDGRSEPPAYASAPANLDMGQLQAIRLEKNGNALALYAAGMHLLTLTLPSDEDGEALGAGRIGYAVDGAQARFGYVAFSGSVGGSGAGQAYAPLPGRVDAHADEAGLARTYGLRDDGGGGLAAAKLDAAKPLTYRVRVAKDGAYSIDFRAAAGPDGARFRLTEDGKPVGGDLELKPAPGPSAWRTVSVHGAELKAGYHRWTLEVEQGKLDADWFDVSPYAQVVAKRDDFDVKNIPGWTRFEGVWSVKDGQLRVSSAESGKILTGDDGWTDYSVQADVTVPADGGTAGLLARVTDPANGMELNQNRDDFLRGYYVYVDGAGVHLARHNYDTVPLADAALPAAKPGDPVRLKVTASGTVLSVYAGGAAKPVIVYDDNGGQALLHGRAGLKATGGAARFDGFRIDPVS
ncbi:family 43 glycosylhydrolase [Paenibacillus sp. MWE-103]|uniref:Family 43 glycosylhydrolase n=1 Tax=Paenibacillus artemisiicola TaxID=1172618 RepID=A0ABS3WI10_9BACL|nr:family 43 glycosylhydrolase [Paenibacillus artemisiicola]MBO7747963.1 family 43 glycosylhydrolase [Paenibacillus artemisiicola]